MQRTFFKKLLCSVLLFSIFELIAAEKKKAAYTLEALNAFPEGKFSQSEIENAVTELNKFGDIKKYDPEHSVPLPKPDRFYKIFPKNKILTTTEKCPLLFGSRDETLIQFYIVCTATPVNGISSNYLGLIVFSDVHKRLGNRTLYKYDAYFDHYETPASNLKAIDYAIPSQAFAARFIRLTDEWPTKIVILDIEPLS